MSNLRHFAPIRSPILLVFLTHEIPLLILVIVGPSLGACPRDPDAGGRKPNRRALLKPVRGVTRGLYGAYECGRCGYYFVGPSGERPCPSSAFFTEMPCDPTVRELPARRAPPP